jgi:hypothetical protein
MITISKDFMFKISSHFTTGGFQATGCNRKWTQINKTKIETGLQLLYKEM